MIDLPMTAGRFSSSEEAASPASTRRFGRRAGDNTGTWNITALLGAVFLVGAIIVGAIIASAASNQNREASARSTELVRALLESYERRLGPSVADYAWWDDAVQNLALTPDAEWADANVGNSFHESYGADMVFVFDSANGMTMKFADGLPASTTAIDGWTGGIDRIIAAARATPAENPEPASGWVSIDGRIHFIALAALTPFSDPLLWPGDRPRYLFGAAWALDRELLAGMSEGFGLHDFNIESDAAANSSALILTGPDGTTLGYLSWRQHRPGDDLIKSVLPPVGFALVLMGVLILLAMRRVEALAASRRADLVVIAERNDRLRVLTSLREATFGAMNEGISVVDKDQLLVDWNAAYLRMFGLPDDLVRSGVPMETLVRFAAKGGRYGVGDVEEIVTERLRRARAGEPQAEELTSRNGDVLELRRSPMPGGGTVYSYRDITARKHGEIELHAARLEAERANRAKSEFIAKMSHELRTPLNAVIGFSEIMQNEMAGPIGKDIYREYSGDINASGRMLLSLVNDILDLAKIEAGRFELSEDRVNPVELVDSVVTMLESRARTSGVDIVLDMASDLPEILADSRSLRQILLNLVSNAVKFTAGGGRVSIAARRAAHGGVQFRIADTGVGIAAADLPRALEPFGQVGGRSTTAREGTGLGLPISRALVELHGGSLVLESEVGIGTTVTVELPAHRSLA